MKKPVTDYREFRLSKLNSPEFKHVKLLLYWPVYGLLFLFVERFYQPEAYYSMHCALDDLIPFCEYFIVPYLLWFPYQVFVVAYFIFFNKNKREYYQLTLNLCMGMTVFLIV